MHSVLFFSKFRFILSLILDNISEPLMTSEVAERAMHFFGSNLYSIIGLLKFYIQLSLICFFFFKKNLLFLFLFYFICTPLVRYVILL